MYPYYPPKIAPHELATNGQFPLAALAFFVRERRGLGGCPQHKTQRHPISKIKTISRITVLTNDKEIIPHSVLALRTHLWGAWGANNLP